MLMAAGIEPPTQVWAHGFLLVGGEKMSKTKLTGIHPFELIDHFGVDAYRYYFMREIQFGGDGSFSWESMLERYNADLANDFGNLASRVLAMTAVLFRRGGTRRGLAEPGPEAPAGRKRPSEWPNAMDEHVAGHADLTGIARRGVGAHQGRQPVAGRGRAVEGGQGPGRGGRSSSGPSTRASRCCGSWRS